MTADELAVMFELGKFPSSWGGVAAAKRKFRQSPG